MAKKFILALIVVMFTMGFATGMACLAQETSDSEYKSKSSVVCQQTDWEKEGANTRIIRRNGKVWVQGYKIKE